jgi:hypothetical protein
MTSKRRCTRSATASVPHHRFFQQLSTRPLRQREPFEKHFLPSSPMCQCELYPVYSSKLHSDAKLPPELDSLCLSCAFHLCQSLGGNALGALCHWLPNARSEEASFYSLLYDQKEAAAIMPARASEAYNALIMGSAQTMLERLGVCGL